MISEMYNYTGIFGIALSLLGKAEGVLLSLGFLLTLIDQCEQCCGSFVSLYLRIVFRV